GRDESYGRTVYGFTFAYPTDFGAVEKPSRRIHQVHVCGLQPSTRYHYRVGTGAGRSQDLTFTTAPNGPSPMRVLVLGDSRGDANAFGQALQKGAEEMPDFVIFTGDAVELAYDQPAWDAWFERGGETLTRLPMVFAHGNHEANARHYYSQFPQGGNQ